MSDLYETLKLLILGLTAGVLSGLFGIGGGLVIVPALIFFFGYEARTAVGTSLFVILLPTGLLGVINYWRAGELKAAAGLWIALGVFVGAYFGSRVGVSISDVTMKRIYGAFLLVVGAYLLAGPSPGQPSTAKTPPSAQPSQIEPRPGPLESHAVH
jgi:uncharacterized protein